jgi:predicted dehydrogenase
MYFLSSKQWKDGLLDYAMDNGPSVRISIRAISPIATQEDCYFVRPKSMRMLWEYYKEIGLRNVALKIVSRFTETLRNDKWLSVGIGTVETAKQTDLFQAGDPVLFVAPLHPKSVERIVIHPALVRSVAPTIAERFPSDAVSLSRQSSFWPDELFALGGFSTSSGLAAPEISGFTWEHIERFFIESNPTEFRRLSIPEPTAVKLRQTAEKSPKTDNPKAVLLGLGNYAKTTILPNLDPRLQLVRVHEIDPCQIGLKRIPGVTYDTRSEINADDPGDLYLIAGYHHSHASLAVDAINIGKAALVEKPIVTNWQQLEKLSESLNANPGKLYCGFHKRHQPTTVWALDDLRDSGEQCIHYQAVVYEVPLPAKHWYRWPNSRSRLTSNGCHWIDHFLFLNDYSRPTKKIFHQLKNEDYLVALELENGATFTMTLTDKGSWRVGLRETIFLRSGDRTVEIVDSRHYRAEDSRKILHRRHCEKLEGHRLMYRHLSTDYLEGRPGESVEQLDICSRIILELEDEIPH